MQTLSEIRALLEARGVRPKHRLGQNFLHDHNQLRRIVAAADVSAGDLVLEVGPGTGTLTEALVEAEAEVVSVELDEDMARIVEARLGDRITLLRGDCLDRRRHLSPEILETLGDRPFRLVANLPYQAATPLMMDLLLRRPTCLGQVALIQKEVADRLAANAGGREYGPISILTAALGSISRVGNVPPGCFWPAPKVVSAVVSILPRPNHGVEHPERFADFVGELFRTRRKQIGATLNRMKIAAPVDLDVTRRPESMPPHELLQLFRDVGLPAVRSEA
ncbi:MAG: ribosomal RNA small subunit methyltransferase A [Phycisphaera sp.]|nr:ribosomal RNA small subunit methyltransferase A [Phycisphaera sp.]